MAETQQAKLSPRYWIKQVVLAVLVLGLGVWGFYDGFILYPAQAVKFAEWTEWEYLDFLDNPPPAASAGANLGVASIPDPVETYDRLGNPSYNRNPATMDDVRGNWLDALSIVNRLDPQYTKYPRENADEGEIGSAFERLAALRETWGDVDRGNAPKRRSRFDIMAQYPIFLVGAGLGLYFAYGLFRALGTRYAWDPDAKRITLPGGIEVEPEHVAEFDKSQWHKFYVVLRLNDSHPTHAGKNIKVDLYRHQGVEDWILEMERERFPDQAEATPDDASTSEIDEAAKPEANAGPDDSQEPGKTP
ncbi:MAG: hypothetical protein RIE77_11455 [Phycisphaerales bacterium]|jgi:hypothetical protein